MKRLSWLILPCMLGPQLAWADSSEEMAQLRRQVQQLTALVQRLNERLAAVEQTAEASPGPSAAGPSGQGLSQQARCSLSAFNPEIGVLADIVGQDPDLRVE